MVTPLRTTRPSELARPHPQLLAAAQARPLAQRGGTARAATVVVRRARRARAGIRRRGSRSRRAPLGPALGRGLVVARQPVVRELLPGRLRGDERVERRPDPRVAVERAEPDPDLVALGPLVPEQARAADRAERLYPSALGAVDADQLLALQQLEPFARHAPLGLAEGPGVLAAARAVAVAC